MSHYKPYPVYKNSGVEWIGEVPEHWEVLRIKRTAQVANDRCNDVPKRLVYIGLEDVEARSGQYKPTSTTSRQSEESTVALFQKDDVLYGKLRPYLRKCITAPVNGVCSTEFLVLKPSLVSPFWLQSWLLTQDVTQQIEAGCDGAKMPRADWEHIGSIHIPAPDKLEQDSILNTLNRETARIDALIAKKTRFIELLKEKRQALITHAVTKGLDSKVKMKYSGEKWLGNIPEHWDVIPSQRLFDEGKERARLDDQHLSATQKYGVIPLAEYERLESRQVTHAEKNLEQRKHAEVDNFVISMRSFEGGIERVRAQGCVRSSYIVLVAGQKAHVGFFTYLFKSSSYIQGLQATATFIRDGQDLSYNNFRQVKLPCLNIDEQKVISDFLDRAIARIDLLSGKTQFSINLLKERRSAFITAAVTGKIDVRNINIAKEHS
ncbi:MAG: restriction endonuclease subunit S [Geobacteraceae bacterium]